MSRDYVANLRDRYVRELQPPQQVEVNLAALPRTPRPPGARGMTAGERAYGLRLGEWVRGLLRAWYRSGVTGEWIGLVEYTLTSSNGKEALMCTGPFPRSAIREVPAE